MDQLKFVEDSLQKFEGVWSAKSTLQIFQRLSSTNFICSILEYFVPFDTASFLTSLISGDFSMKMLLSTNSES